MLLNPVGVTLRQINDGGMDALQGQYNLAQGLAPVYIQHGKASRLGRWPYFDVAVGKNLLWQLEN